MNATHLVVGLGEVGKALIEVLSPTYHVEGVDIEPTDLKVERFDFVHICYPFSDGFVGTVKAYADDHLKDSGLVVIHSSVPVGTTEAVGPRAVHSPIRGVHPELAKGIGTFVKYFGGPKAAHAAAYFSDIGIPVAVKLDSRNTEALKLWDTTQYGLQIVLEKAIHAYCDEHGLDFDFVYTEANRSYNRGYTALGMEHVVRPFLKHVPGKIGGHCVIPNAKLLGGLIGDFILKVDAERHDVVE